MSCRGKHTKQKSEIKAFKIRSTMMRVRASLSMMRVVLTVIVASMLVLMQEIQLKYNGRR